MIWWLLRLSSDMQFAYLQIKLVYVPSPRYGFGRGDMTMELLQMKIINCMNI